MQESHTTTAMRAALQYLISSEMPAAHKAVLIGTLTDALRNREAAERDVQHDLRAWHPDEASQVESSLHGRVAKSWQDADESLMQLATRLDRTPDDVRRMAKELGVGAGVDYALAKARPRDHDE